MLPERKVVLFVHLSLDGFAAGVNGELDWASYDNELENYAEELVKNTSTAIYGRVTYQLMASYWPTILTKKSASKFETEHATWVENVQKIVFSKTLEKAEWNNTILIKDNIKDEVLKIKQEPGKNLMIFGSPGIAKTFMNLDLIDEYRLTINPVILGKGIPLFDDIKNRINLKLIQTRTFNSGVVGLHYERK